VLHYHLVVGTVFRFNDVFLYCKLSVRTGAAMWVALSTCGLQVTCSFSTSIVCIVHSVVGRGRVIKSDCITVCCGFVYNHTFPVLHAAA